MKTNITITKQSGSHAAGRQACPVVATTAVTAQSATAAAAAPAAARKLPGWLWFVALWCFGVVSAVSLGFAFKLLMNATLFAVK
jgi:hypothetical protein